MSLTFTQKVYQKRFAAIVALDTLHDEIKAVLGAAFPKRTKKSILRLAAKRELALIAAKR